MAINKLSCLESLVLIAIVVVTGMIVIPTIISVTPSHPSSTARAMLEINQLSQGFAAYKNYLGDYPPDFSANDTLALHISTAFPMCEDDLSTWLSTQSPIRSPSTLDQAEAIVFWLSELSQDRRHPLTGAGDRLTFFEFDEIRLTDIDHDGWHEYAPNLLPESPYVYIDERTSESRYPASPTGGITGTARSYKRIDASGKSFQIICAGRDGDYGSDQTGKTFPTGIGYANGDLDNITNFSDGMTLEEAIP